MGINFDKLGSKNLLDTQTEPGTLFNALPRPKGSYSYLRNVQSEVLEAWYARRTERDIVLKMNTGAGKTVVGLLLLKSCLNEHVGPAAYFAPDKYLSGQVILEAQKLGIEVTDDIDQRFLSGKAILVDNMHRLVNGRSKFGVGSRNSLGTVVLDDTHSCLRIAEENFTLTLPAEHAAYKEMFALLRSSLEQQSLLSALDIADGDPIKLLSVPYWTWRDKHADIVSIVRNYRDTKEMEWSWPLVKDALPNCACIFSGRQLSISARCLNIGLIRDFELAKRRIYMTATLADDSSLVTHLRANADSIAKPVTPKSASDLGDRMILAPQQLNPEIKDEEIRAFLAK